MKEEEHEYETQKNSSYFHCKTDSILPLPTRGPLPTIVKQQHQHEEKEEEEAPLSEMKEAILGVTPLSEVEESSTRWVRCIFSFGMKKVKLFGSKEKSVLLKRELSFRTKTP
jgi:hypothetical protein